MTVTREDIADLMPGDVVEFRHPAHPAVVIQGPLHEDADGWLVLGNISAIRFTSGEPSRWAAEGELIVIERVPRPLYVNHSREKAEPGDVVRNADDEGGELTWVYADAGDSRPWLCAGLTEWYSPERLPKRLRLLVDGETGQVVPHE